MASPPEQHFQRSGFNARVPVARVRPLHADVLALPATGPGVARVDGVDAEPQYAVISVDLD
jgi:hypothetical protein